ncbi:MAG: TRAP transporter small permease [Hyphomicrobiales bacterium]|nr:TRAP transporter small permease [Hyphomicrobiales bacterium]
MQTLNRWVAAATKWLAWFGIVLLMAAVVVTTADVILRKTVGFSLEGTVDITQLMVMGAAYTAIPFAFVTRSHVAVAMLTDGLSRRGQAAVQVLAAVLAVGFMAAIATFGWFQAMQEFEYGDSSLTLGIPKIWYWAPLLTGAALSTLVMALLALEHLYTAVTGRGTIPMADG